MVQAKSHLALKAGKSGGKEAKGENRKSEIRREGMMTVESIIGGQRRREGETQAGVAAAEWTRDAWGKGMK